MPSRDVERPDGLPVPQPDEASASAGSALRERLADRPLPAAVWVAVGVLLLAPQAGALLHFATSLAPGVPETSLPTLLSHDTLPNRGYQTPDGTWHGTAFGLSPAAVWGLRVALVYLYAACWGAWAWAGYRVYRSAYRVADWTPLDDAIDRFRSHRWGQFGLIVVFCFLTMAVFAPAVSPTTVEANIAEPYMHNVTYYDTGTGSVETIAVGTANLETISQGQPDKNVGLFTYDTYDRWHPFGTLPSGRDLFTFMAYGARVSLLIGLLSIAMSSVLAVAFGLSAAYYRGKIDLGVVVLADAVQSLPQLLVLILVSVAFAGTWFGTLYSGGILIAVVFALTGWPGLWRAIRGPALQVAHEDWVAAARGFGQRPTATMRKHILPYVLGYLLIYASMILGGVIIGIAGLSYLGLGVSSPTPEWGRAISAGEPYLASVSWHIAFVPGLLVVLVVTAFNALGDGIRDAVDPKSESGDAEAAAAGGGA